jgi:hypothetical protein
MGKDMNLTETQKKFLLEINSLPDKVIEQLLGIVKTIKKGLGIEEGTSSIIPFESRGTPGEILKIINATPHLDIQDTDELRRLIKEGKQAARFEDPFSR